MERVEFQVPELFKADLESYAERRDLNRAQYIRESIRRQMQRDLAKGRVSHE